MQTEHMQGAEFVALAEKILGQNDRYEDEMMLIRRNYNGLDLEVTRKEMPQVAPHLRVSNPTTMVSKGSVIRHHGEHCYLVPHMLQLAARL